MKVLYLNRYSTVLNKRNNSGYEIIPKYLPDYFEVKDFSFASKLLSLFLKKSLKDCYEGYLFSTCSKDVIALFLSIFLRWPIHILYGDKDGFLILLTKKKLPFLPIKLYATIHWPLKHFRNPQAKLEYYQLFDKVIVMGPSLANEVSPWVKELAIIPHGINLNFWNPSMVKKNDLHKKYVFILGGSNRNHELQIHISTQIFKKFRLKAVVRVPNKELQDRYRKIPGAIVLQNFINDEELRDWMGNAWALLIVQDYCIASNAILEAMALGVPVLANDVGDVSFYLGERYPLFIDSNSFLEKVANLFHDKEWYEKVSNYLMNRSRAYSWEVVAKETKNFLGCS